MRRRAIPSSKSSPSTRTTKSSPLCSCKRSTGRRSGRLFSETGELPEADLLWRLSVLNDSIRSRGFYVPEAYRGETEMAQNELYELTVFIPANGSVSVAVALCYQSPYVECAKVSVVADPARGFASHRGMRAGRQPLRGDGRLLPAGAEARRLFTGRRSASTARRSRSPPKETTPSRGKSRISASSRNC